MTLEELSKQLKELISTYDTGWLLGDLSGLMHAGGNHTAADQLGKLSSPQRQLYYLAGLLMTSDPRNGTDNMYDPDKWDEIVNLLNKIEQAYAAMFFPKDEVVDDHWQKVRKVAMPSFLDYFNQGPLNFEEQIINWVKDLYAPLDGIVIKETGLQTADFLQFYANVDALHQKNFQGVGLNGTPRANWRDYAKVQMVNTAPEPLKAMMDDTMEPVFYYMADHGIIDRFYANELVSPELPIEKVETILNLLSAERKQSDFLYYTAMKPGNPLYEKPIANLGDGMYQIFEVKQVIHAIESLLEKTCSKTKADTTALVARKGNLLEDRIEELFKALLKRDYKIFRGYYVDGCEQDLLILWKNYAFIIEAKGYNLREPLRDPDKAFVRIKDDFRGCIGYGYDQCRRVESKFLAAQLLDICDNKGNVLETIDTSEFEDNAFSVVVNLKTFGQVQIDLSSLLEIPDESSYPWAVKLDDLETFILTLLARGKGPKEFLNFLRMRETLHDKLICNDELQVCGAFLTGTINQKLIDSKEVIMTTPDHGNIFDQQYRKGIGFRDEKYLIEKKSGRWLFW
ncbi:NERD domain-containing protein [Parapedobacter sp. ISTM3]|uniref:NERD domain-containing protein n=1 Tax=Parapedobacter sp. ISTM3 TaxID=2800130 RepID=UPI0019032EEC|nr:NERD domain-containing protein [Parapedobacter sp. ISTM3]MBK1439965.1 NERD domain-containing protein [Parapedobacter sp. ISTM3]